MPKSNIVESLNEMNEKDIYSMMLFALYKLKDDPAYSVLSELIYLVDKESLLKLLSVFEGMIIKIPRLSDLKTLVAALEVYQMVNVEGMEFKEAIKIVKTDEVFEGEIKQAYFKICSVLSEYSFTREDKNAEGSDN